MPNEDETAVLLRRLADGDVAAGEKLLRRHRERLTRMVSMRVDRRLSGRFDPSDVVQEALLIANQRLSTYAQEQKIPFDPWLRGIAWEQLLKFHMKHVAAAKRSINREERQSPQLNDESIHELVNRVADGEGTPSEDLIKREQRRRVRQALASLRPIDREVIELRYLEHLDNAEIAAILDIGVNAVRTRHFRAIQRLHQAMKHGNES